MHYDEDPYPQTVDVKYPTVGTTNPSVRLAVYDSEVQCTQWVDLSGVIEVRCELRYYGVGCDASTACLATLYITANPTIRL